MKTLELKQMETLQGGISWSDCFTGAAGSTQGIALTIFAGFYGPEAVLGAYIGMGIGCAIFA